MQDFQTGTPRLLDESGGDDNSGPVTGRTGNLGAAAQVPHLLADAVEAILVAGREGRVAPGRIETFTIILNGNFYRVPPHRQSHPDLGCIRVVRTIAQQLTDAAIENNEHRFRRRVLLVCLGLKMKPDTMACLQPFAEASRGRLQPKLIKSRNQTLHQAHQETWDAVCCCAATQVASMQLSLEWVQAV